jgi:tetratricopeptide (TPR) repeat protein
VQFANDDNTRADRIFDVGHVLEKLSQFEEAMEKYEHVLALMPRHQPALHALERLYQGQHRWQKYAQLLERELELNHPPERRFELLMDLASTLNRLGDPQAAVLQLEEALRLQPHNPSVLWTLEQLYASNHPLKLAHVLCLRANLEEDAASKANLYFQAAELLAEQGDKDSAFSALQETLRWDPGNRVAFTLCETQCYERKEWSSAMELYERAILYVTAEGGKAYRPVDLYLRRGQLQLNQLNKIDEAINSYLKALECDPKSESVMKMLENLFLQQLDWQGLINVYE